MKKLVKHFITTLLLSIVSVFTVSASDTITVKIKLKALNDTLTFNHKTLKENYLEYSWAVLIDTDNNNTTGNADGFDVKLAIAHFKVAGGVETKGKLIPNTQHSCAVFTGNSAVVTNTLVAYIDYADTSIVMKGAKSWSELADVDDGDRFMCETYYNDDSLSAPVTDKTISGVLPNKIEDQTGDVLYDFMDIKEVTITYPQSSVGVSEQVNEIADFEIFPNPFSQETKIKFNAAQTNTIILKLYDSNGRIVKMIENQNTINEITLSRKNSANGIYYLEINNGKEIIGRKKIVIN